MRTYTLITGASSGIGCEMAEILASKGHNLILVARSQSKLEHLQQRWMSAYPVDIVVLFYDLAEPHAARELYQDVKAGGYRVTGLINNAGFGTYGSFVEMPLKSDEEMIAVNITAVVGLTKLFGADMVSRGEGRIMQIASLLSFLPFPYYSVYSATKSFVLAFAETVSAELAGTGVTVTALCPGPVDTPFQSDQMRNTRAMSANKPMTARVVAEAGVELFLQGRGKKIVGLLNWFLSNLPRVTPDSIMIRIKKHLASPKMDD